MNGRQAQTGARVARVAVVYRCADVMVRWLLPHGDADPKSDLVIGSWNAVAGRDLPDPQQYSVPHPQVDDGHPRCSE